MRGVFYCLVVLNVSFFIWQAIREPVSEAIQLSAPAGSRIPTIELLSESGIDDRSVQMDEIVNNPLVSTNVGDGQCEALGPFLDIVSSQEVLERLSALDGVPVLRAVDQPTGEYDFRVMLAPAVSLEEAFRKLRELQNQKIDSYVITKGRDALAISLGVFSTREAADSAEARFQRDGYDARIRAIERVDRRYWLFAAPGTHLVIPVAIEAELAEQYDVDRAPVVCPDAEPATER
ncbi:MAG: hypothetical protein O2780_18075 [Proteobacteria bacterium]|jgi:hypothetical protein|nr:hypothetical protein [Pseudomonadota bacterium]MDA1300288.1 hypothetical protein [Pseudomonadota bacterium]